MLPSKLAWGDTTPRPEIAATTNVSTASVRPTVKAACQTVLTPEVRRWALVLCEPRHDPQSGHVEMSQPPLPPLKPIKPYTPSPGGSEFLASTSCGGATSIDGGRTVESGVSDLASPYTLFGGSCGFDEEFIFQPPPISQLHAEVSFRDEAEEALDAPQELVRVAAMATAECQVEANVHRVCTEVKSCRQAHVVTRRHQVNREHISARHSPVRRRLLTPLASDIVHQSPSRPAMRGTDPLAGSLFSRHGRPDPEVERNGIYETHLRAGTPYFVTSHGRKKGGVSSRVVNRTKSKCVAGKAEDR
eukprot:TRINITY_DN44502_c0_g1_i1.p1 TRINITY_DN44502_c0_g1~~TRINITY_DN44502_c0_g1_i1.p1  ORF type:complete len:303 (-),score=25.50 TRINITY_DN44502_c0_g1_i1:105-1013(-)